MTVSLEYRAIIVYARFESLEQVVFTEDTIDGNLILTFRRH